MQILLEQEQLNLGKKVEQELQHLVLSMAEFYMLTGY